MDIRCSGKMLGQSATATTIKYIGLLSAGGECFFNCSSLEEVQLCQDLEDVYYEPYGLYRTFYGCANLKRISGLSVEKLVYDIYDLWPNISSSQRSTHNLYVTMQSFYHCTSLEDCMVHGTLRATGVDLHESPLNDDSISSWLNSLYDWQTNSEGISSELIDMQTNPPYIIFNESAMQRYLQTTTNVVIYNSALSKGWLVQTK